MSCLFFLEMLVRCVRFYVRSFSLLPPVTCALASWWFDLYIKFFIFYVKFFNFKINICWKLIGFSVFETKTEKLYFILETKNWSWIIGERCKRFRMRRNENRKRIMCSWSVNKADSMIIIMLIVEGKIKWNEIRDFGIYLVDGRRRYYA